jgi:hypothetical protein
VRRHVGRAAEDAHDVQRLPCGRRSGGGGDGAEHGLSQNVRRLGVIHRDGHNGHARALQVLRHVVRRLLRLRGRERVGACVGAHAWALSGLFVSGECRVLHPSGCK